MVGRQFESTFKYVNVSLALDEAQLCRNAAGIIKKFFWTTWTTCFIHEFFSQGLKDGHQGRAAHLCFNKVVNLNSSSTHRRRR